MKRVGLAISAILALGAVAGPALGQDDGARLKRGEALLARGTCHAVGRADASKHNLAIPFRQLSGSYAVESLQEALAEGLISGHPDMPEFKFAPDDVGAIIAYLKSIQVKYFQCEGVLRGACRDVAALSMIVLPAFRLPSDIVVDDHEQRLVLADQACRPRACQPHRRCAHVPVQRQ
jgi:cytochrome c